MNRISAGITFYLKRVFPALWLGGVGVAFAVGLFGAFSGQLRESVPFLLVPLLMIGFGIVIFRRFLWDLADSVLDGGDVLVVRRGSVEQRVRLVDVMNVNVSTYMNPPRITLRLTTSGRLGREIAFVPVVPFTLNPFARIPIAEQLIERVDAARRGSGR